MALDKSVADVTKVLTEVGSEIDKMKQIVNRIASKNLELPDWEEIQVKKTLYTSYSELVVVNNEVCRY